MIRIVLWNSEGPDASFQSHKIRISHERWMDVSRTKNGLPTEHRTETAHRDVGEWYSKEIGMVRTLMKIREMGDTHSCEDSEDFCRDHAQGWYIFLWTFAKFVTSRPYQALGEHIVKARKIWETYLYL